MLYDKFLSFGRLSCTDPGPRLPPAAGKARTDPPQRPAQTPLPPCQIRVPLPPCQIRVSCRRQQTGRPTGRAAAPRTLRPGRRGPVLCTAAPRHRFIFSLDWAKPSRKSINHHLLIRQLKVCSVVWVRAMVIRHVPLRGVRAGLEPCTKACHMTMRSH